ncbi:MAG: radical SAM protein [Candidatus Aminicenantes bacterium]|nr:MAG: radical SAM protein [Candidatus Aminicenantes bacterium]
MSEQLYIKSPFVFEYQISEGVCCLYNSITIDVMYVLDKRTNELWDRFERGTAINFDGMMKSDFLYALLKKRFIVKSEEGLIDDIISRAEKEVRVRDSNIKILYVVPTLKCNLDCKYCHIEYLPSKYKELDIDPSSIDKGLKLFFRYADVNEKLEIIFYGGEPFLRFDLVEYVVDRCRSEYGKYNLKYTVFTNATMIKEEQVKFIKDNHLFLIVSLDGDKCVNDISRHYKSGKGSFEDIRQCCQMLRRYDVKFGVSLVMGTHNIDRLEECVRYIMNEIRPVDLGISTLHLFPDGGHPYEVPIESLTERMIEVFKLVRTKNFYVEHLFRRIRPFVEQKIRWKDCPSCGNKLLIYPKNRIGFCEAFMGTDNYNVDLDGFDLETDEGYKQWSARSPLLNRPCYECPAIGICGGGCPYDAFVSKGSIMEVDERRCVQSKKLLAWLLDDLYNTFPIRNVDCGYYMPTPEDRRRLYGNIVFGSHIPLQTYSSAGEKDVKL